VATVNAQPDLGAESEGKNIIRSNGRYGSTTQPITTLVAVGNDIDTKRISGKVDVVAGQIAFQDVQGYWAQPYIEALAAKRLLLGFPVAPLNRLHALSSPLVSKAFAPTPQRKPLEFSDVSRNFWGYQAIQCGGFVAGYPGGVFQPQQIPRVQVLVSLANGLSLRSNNPSALSIYDLPRFLNMPLPRRGGNSAGGEHPTKQLNPNREATRAEVAAFVYRHSSMPDAHQTIQMW